MSLLQLIIIAAIQGVTEWLPISSSGHVLLAADYFGLKGRDEFLINAMAHIGTLFAVLLYFWRDVLRAIRGGVELVAAPFRQAKLSGSAHLALMILASMPIAFLAAIVHETLLPSQIQAAIRSVYTVAATTIVFGLLLWWADVKGSQGRHQADMTLSHAVLIGATQAVAALLPGTSRSGITMTAARALGYARTDAARFSMLIGAPILAAAGLYAGFQLATADSGGGTATFSDGVTVAALSFVTGFASIAGLMALLKRMSFFPFVLYRFALGAALLLSSPVFGLF